jgi:uncharacterized protein YycO
MASLIRPTRLEVNDRFPMVGFTIRPDRNVRRFEVAVATDPKLFRPESKAARTPASFYSTRAQGPIGVAREEAVYVLPPEILAGFVGQPRLYYALATYAGDGAAKPEVAVLPTDNSPFISLRGLTGRTLRRIRVLPSRQRAAAGYGNGTAAFEWAGDAPTPGLQPMPAGRPNGAASRTTNGSAPPAPGPTTAPAAAAAPAAKASELASDMISYDDGFGPLPAPPHPAAKPAPAPPTRGRGPVASRSSDRLRKPVTKSVGLAADIPLDPGNGGQSIGPDALETGDIIVSTTDAASSGAIRFATGAQVSHAMIYADPGRQTVIEAIGEGVKERPLAEAIAPATLAVAFRYPGLSDLQRQQIVETALSHVGQPYDRIGIVRQALFKVHSVVCDLLGDDSAKTACRNFIGRVDLGTGNNNEFFCSELIVAAYQAAGVPITTTPPIWTTPGDLVDLAHAGGTLAYVGHLKAPPVGASRSVFGLGMAATVHPLVADKDDVEKAQRYAGQWADLINWHVAPAVDAALTARKMHVQRLEDAIGDLNLDRYEVRIDAMPGGYDAAGLLDHIRTHLDDFIDTSKSNFLPYAPGVDDAQWSSKAPVGAVYKILIPPGDNGAVVGSLVEPLRWRFTTVHTPDTADHPVSGHREFGMRQGGDANVFYTRGADRTTGFIETFADRLAWRGADALWRSLQQKVADFVNTNGGAATVPDPFSERFNWKVVDILVSQNGGATPSPDAAAVATALAEDDVVARAAAVSPELAQAVRDALAGGHSSAEVSDVLDNLGVPAASSTAAAALAALALDEPEHRYSVPAPPIVLPSWAAPAAIASMIAVLAPLAPFLVPFIATLPGAARSGNVCIALGPAVEIGLLEGGGLGAGVVFAPDGRIGLYAKTEKVFGFLKGASATLQLTVTKGGLEHFAGSGYAVGVKIDLEPAVVGVQALLDENRNFHGITVQGGVGKGVPGGVPVEIYWAAEKTYSAAQAFAAGLQYPRRLRTEALDAAPTKPSVVAPGTTLERLARNSGGVTWALDQLHGFKRPVSGAGANSMPQSAPTLMLQDWPFLHLETGDRVYAAVAVNWRYDGSGLGDIAIAPGPANVPHDWNLRVAAEIRDAQDTPAGSAVVASLAVAVRYEFTMPAGDVAVAVVEFHLFGDGTWEQSNRWEHAMAAAA